MKRLFIVSIAVMLGGASGGAASPRLQGTFIQLTRANADWDEARWEQLFGRFRDMGLSEVVVQWSTFSGWPYPRRLSSRPPRCWWRSQPGQPSV